MKKITWVLLISIVSVLFANDIGVVNTNVLSIKKEASNSSKKLGFYKHSTFIDILEEHEGLDSDEMWLETKKGFVKAQYVLQDSKLPKIIDASQLDTSLRAIQLAVFTKDAKALVYSYRNKLKGEKNLYIKETSKAQVLYLVNIDSSNEAKEIKQRVRKNFKDAFITKIKSSQTLTPNINKIKKQVIKEKPKKATSTKSAGDNYNGDIDMNEIDNIIESLNDDNIESIDLDVKIPKKEVVKKEIAKKTIENKTTQKTQPKNEIVKKSVQKVETKKEDVKKVETKPVLKKEVSKETTNIPDPVSPIKSNIAFSLQDMRKQLNNRPTQNVEKKKETAEQKVQKKEVKKEIVKKKEEPKKVVEKPVLKPAPVTFESAIETMLQQMQ